MEYKVGDKIRIKTWKEMSEEFKINWNGDINISQGNAWPKSWEKHLPYDRIITITKIGIPNTTHINIYYTYRNCITDHVFPEMVKEKVMGNKEEIMKKIKELESKTEELKSIVGNLDKKEWADTFEESKELFPYWGFTDLDNNRKFFVVKAGSIMGVKGFLFTVDDPVTKGLWKNNGKTYIGSILMKYKFKGFNSEKELYAWMAK